MPDTAKMKAAREELERLASEYNQDSDGFRKLLEGKVPTRWSEYPKLGGDWLLLNDLHLPFADWKLMDKAIKIASFLKIRQVAVLGDFVDCEAISSFDFGADEFSVMQELNVARGWLAQMSERFDKIFLLRGNHDERIIKFLKRVKRMFERETSDNEYLAYGAILGVNVSKKAWEQYRDFFASERVEISNFSKCGFCDKYIGLHPSSYSRIAPQTERKMSNKYLKHVIGTHGHLSGIGFHDSAQFIDIQLGGLVDKNLIFYKNMRETTHPEWVGAFGWIVGGKIGYYFDHPDLIQITDYVELWENSKT